VPGAIGIALGRALTQGRGALVPFLTSGFPDPDESDQDDPRPRWSVTRDLRSRSWTAIGCGLLFGAVAFVQITYRLLTR